MGPLIQIITVPIELQMRTKNATLEHARGTAEMEISRSDNGGLDIKSRPIKLQFDSFESRNAFQPTTMRNVAKTAQDGLQASYEATATYARHGQLMLNAKLGENTTALFSRELSEQRATLDAGMGDAGISNAFMHNEGVEIEAEGGNMQIRYEMEKINFDWKIDSGEFKFTPGDVEISVVQHPDVLIRYTGGPIYVPASSDPNYEPVDVKA